MKVVIGIILIVAGIYLGYKGYKILQDSSASIEIGNVEIGAKDAKKESNGYVWIGVGVVAILGGVIVLTRKPS